MNASSLINALDELQVHVDGALSVRQVQVLLWLSTRTEITSVMHIADALDLSKPAITRATDRLAEDGLLTRADYPGDRRMVDIKLTAQGRAAVAAALATLDTDPE